MTALVTADLHLNDLARDSYRHDFLRSELPRLVETHEVQDLLILGDLTHQKDRHTGRLTNEIADAIVNLSRMCRVIILRGNHDYYIDETYPSFKFLGYMTDIVWVNEPTELLLAEEIGAAMFLPQTKNHAEWEGLSLHHYKYIFCHNTFQGAVGEQGFVLDGIPTSVFPKGVRVISGDIHVPQKLGPVVYVGAPYTINFGDDFVPRVLLITGDGVKSINTQGRMKVGLELTVGPHGVNWPKRNWGTGDIFEIDVVLTPEQYTQWHEIRSEVVDWVAKNGYVAHKIIPLVPIKQTAKDARRVKIEHKSDIEIMHDYAKLRNISQDVLAVGLDICEEE